MRELITRILVLTIMAGLSWLGRRGMTGWERKFVTILFAIVVLGVAIGTIMLALSVFTGEPLP